MSKFVGSIVKMLFSAEHQAERERKLRENASVNRRQNRRKKRSVQYADSFIFVPGKDPLPYVQRARANTIADEACTSPSRRIKRTLIRSQDVEDGSSRDSSRAVSFQEPAVPPHSPDLTSATSYEINFPSNEKRLEFIHRPQSCHSFSTEQFYATPADAITPTLTRKWRSDESDLDSLAGEGDYDEIRDPQKLITSLGRPISPRDIILVERLGEGQFGDVHKGVLYQDTPEEAAVAIKTCKPDSTDEDRLKFLQEAAVMKQFNHPHIIKLFGVVTQGITTYIVMELAPLGNLRQYLLIHGPSIPRTTLFEYIRQLCSAMVHLESKNYVHRDIAARNILVVSQDKIKLSDFGLSRWLEEQDCYVASKGKLPIKWMAPESINFRRFTGASDVWMFGVCIWEMLMRGIKPFTGIKNDEVIGKIEQGQRLHLPPECPGPLFNMMNQCWQYYPEERPTFRDIQQQIDVILNNEKQYAAPGRQQIRKSPSGSHNHRLSQGFATEGLDEPPPPTLPPRGIMGGRPLPPEPSRPMPDSRPLPPEPGRPEWRLPSDSPRLDTRPLPPEPPRTELSRQLSHDSRPLPPNPSPTNFKRTKNGSDSSVDPYMITALPGASSSSSSSPTQQLISPPPSEANNKSFSPIPPPAILRSRDPPPQEYEHASQEYEQSLSSSENVYYSTVTDEMGDNGGAIKSSQSSGQLRYSPQGSPPTTNSRSREALQSSSESQYNTLEEEEEEEEEDNEELLEYTTVVVKAVMKLNNELPKIQPTDYIDYVKEVGKALRDLLRKVDEELSDLPEHTHSKVVMAHKVLSSDMANVIQKMKDLQQNYQSFVMEHYQKEMLQASTIVAVNSRVLLDAVTNARKQRHKRT